MGKRGEVDRTELGRSLVALRKDAGSTQVEVVAQTSLSQAQLSRIEQGASLPTAAQAEELGRLYLLDATRRVELVQQVEDARAGIRDERLVIQRGSTLAKQQRWRRLEGEAGLVRSYQPAVVLGVLQTAAYASVVLHQPESSALVQDRLLRYQRLLDAPKPQHLLIQTEGSLRATVGSAAMMAEQLEAVIEASRRPHVRLGVVPAARAADRVTTNAFHLYDQEAVVVGLEVASATLTGASDIAHFELLFDQLQRLAVFGDAARELLGQIGDGYRGPTASSRP